MPAPQRPTSLYFDSLADFAGWTPGADPMDPFRVPLVPLRPRGAQPPGPWVQDCSDFKGGYVQNGDLYPQGTTDPDTYNFSYWQYLDQFIYFSHHRVTIPTTWWTNAAHQNGLPVLGTLIFEDPSGGPDLSVLVNTPGQGGARYQFVDQLVAVAAYYGFDGWLWNVEASLPGDVTVDSFTAFVQALTSAMHQQIPGSQVIWYDSLTVQGSVFYQNGLNGENNAFFQATDGILTNYWWTPDGGELGTSVQTAQTDGISPLRVYSGIDVWGRGTYYQPGFDIYEPLSQCAQAGTSACIYAPGWTFEQASSYADFLQRDAELWTGSTPQHCPGQNVQCVAAYVPERPLPQGLPFATNFDQGQGNAMWVDGSPASPSPWSNLGLQGLLPTWRFCTAGGAGQFSAAWDQTGAFDGGTSLLFSVPSAEPGAQAQFRLFSLQAALSEPATLSWTWQAPAATGALQATPVLVFSDGTTATLAGPSTTQVGNGWFVSTATTGADVVGKTVAELDLVVAVPAGTPASGGYGIRIGAMSVAPQSWSAPSSVQSPEPQGTTWAGGAVTLNLLWTYPAGAARFYDVWQAHGDGSYTWLQRVACNAVWLDAVQPGPADGGAVTLVVQPVDYAGVRQPLTQAAHITVPAAAPERAAGAPGGAGVSR